MNLRKTTSNFLNLKESSKIHQSSLTLKGGSTSHLGLLPSGKKRKPLLSIVFTTPSVPLVGDRNVARNHFILWLADHQRFFRKPTRPSLPLRKAPPLFPSPFPLRGQGMCQPPYSVLKPLRYMVGGPSEVYASSGAAVFCAG